MDFVKRPVAIFCFGFTSSFCLFVNFTNIPRVASLVISLAVFAAFLVFSFAARHVSRTFFRRAALAAAGVAAAIVFALAVFIPSMEKYSYLDGKDAEVCGTVIRQIWTSYKNRCYVLEVSSVDGNDDSFNIALVTESELKAGDEVSAKCRIDKIENTDDDFDSVKYYLSLGITRSAYRDRVLITGKSSSLKIASSKFASEISERIKEGMPEGSGSIVCAVLLGDRDDIPAAYKRDFSRIGISHLIAISGMHVSFIAAALFFILKKLRVPKRISYAVIILSLVFYTFLTGFTPSVVRASAVCCLMCLISVAGISYDGLSALSVCGAAMLAVDPYFAFSAAMIMSYSACVGCFAAVSVIKKSGVSPKRSAPFVKRVFRRLAESVIFTVTVVIFTLPVTLIYYDRTSLISPFSNLIFIPLFSVILYLGALCAIFIPVPPLFAAACFAADKVCAAASSLAGVISKTGGITVMLNYSFTPYFAAAGAAAMICLATLRKKYLKYAAFSLAVCVAGYLAAVYVQRADFGASVKFIRAGSDTADSVIVSSGGKVLLCDTAGDDNIAFSRGLAALSKLHFDTIDALVVSDYSNNSVLRLESLCDSYFIDRVYLIAPYAENEYYFRALEALRDTDTDYEVIECLPETLRFDSATLSFVKCIDDGSGKCAICLKAEGASSSALYLCDGWTSRRSTAPSILKDCSFVVFGATEGVPKDSYSMSLPYDFDAAYSFTQGAHMSGINAVYYPGQEGIFILDLDKKDGGS
ncbi:MAG: ComEC/Rec2 family competence protein [Clostridia bacterium]|nr:ComEC/Rec2 family competence protein [Clostridia bacterium]